ncbi:hypothetical protein PISL3812_07909 [Talaromyces islandicus]|uniref:Arrestin-like N-terminal domain-containing protein n=1 Tax=Talaromyces islandicus TaxID=28573 RepID=A0A0U1M5K3_TALIS|nr:hypothetical protein PISL3812_07909 [Talaromyces islandicus]
MESFTRKASRLKIGIDLKQQASGFVPSYTTLDRIEGEVTIQADRNTSFDHIAITFEGTSKARVQRQGSIAHPSNDISATHPFLKLRQPIDQTSYPDPRQFSPHCLYKFPFTFVVPEQLLPQSCSHATDNPHLQAAHMQPPPSLGDPMMAGDGRTLLDDLAPQMSEISYRICVSVVKRSPTDRKLVPVTAVAKKIRVVPASLEQPPLEVTCNCTNDYRTRKEKDVRKGLVGKKTGRLVMAAAQPKPLQLPPPGEQTDSAVTSHLTVHVRFDPENDEQPPRLKTLWSKLRVLTYFSAEPWTTFPSKNVTMIWNAMQGVYTETVDLSSMCVLSAQWEKHAASDIVRRGSLESTASENSVTGPSTSYAGKSFYTASLIVPISLPKTKAFVPTFHSCLNSRVYALDLSLSYQSPSAKVLASSVSLKIPIQITSAYRETATRDTSDPVLSQMQVEEEFFRPRSIAPPSDEYLEQASLLNRASTSVAGDVPEEEESNPPDYAMTMQAMRTRTSCPRRTDYMMLAAC